ncbi:hypothetical protein K9N68_29490 [Kovacikia minuta CCNUW1]|uniref:hypothetical protein n=1 Tax=Kovacikia minuta TaxID=2931930 RepID=UPI001CCBB8A7|nr:hypothetical protein [Kovacikia minuta]UBF25649.1 hypothetical protein K9N68_29490 [Kovacikia minuta CCNUW1]
MIDVIGGCHQEIGLQPAYGPATLINRFSANFTAISTVPIPNLHGLAVSDEYSERQKAEELVVRSQGLEHRYSISRNRVSGEDIQRNLSISQKKPGFCTGVLEIWLNS